MHALVLHNVTYIGACYCEALPAVAEILSGTYLEWVQTGFRISEVVGGSRIYM